MKNKLMLSCRKASELIEIKQLFGLGFKDNVQLFMHKKMCKACTNFEKQSKNIDKTISLVTSKRKTNTLFLSKEVRFKIHELLKKNRDEPN